MPSITNNVKLTEAQLDAALKALASAQRREILRMLTTDTAGSGKTCCAPEEVCACKFSEQLDLVPSTISHHMTVLRNAGLVSSRKDGTWVYYSARREVLDEVAAAVRLL